MSEKQPSSVNPRSKRHPFEPWRLCVRYYHLSSGQRTDDPIERLGCLLLNVPYRVKRVGWRATSKTCLSATPYRNRVARKGSAANCTQWCVLLEIANCGIPPANTKTPASPRTVAISEIIVDGPEGVVPASRDSTSPATLPVMFTLPSFRQAALGRLARGRPDDGRPR